VIEETGTWVRICLVKVVFFLLNRIWSSAAAEA